jgi:putative transposase
VFATFKYRLYPTKAQIQFLDGQLREACELYNAALEERIGAWKISRKSINYYDQANQLKQMREEGFLGIVNYDCSQNVLRRLDNAFQSFFRRVKRGDKPGFPRFRSRHRYDSLAFPNPGHGYKLLPNGKLRVQGAGHLKIKLHRLIEGRIRTLAIKREAGCWFACFSVERETKPLPMSDAAIGIDVGLTHFATLSDGTIVDNPRYYRKAQAKLRVAQRRVARRKKGSKRRRKAVALLRKTHAHVRNQRSDFHHKFSRKLVNGYGLIAVEDLNVKGLAAGMLAKSVHDAGWTQFFSFAEYKAECADRRFTKRDPRRTSQECICGASVPKGLKDRWHLCTTCGLSAPRDHVSAQVILSRAGNQPSGTNVEVVDSCVSREAVGFA